MALVSIASWLRTLWHKTGSVRLTVVLCLLLVTDLTWGYFCLKNRSPLFAPLNEVGLATWLATYGRHHWMHTAWFFILLGLLAILGLNAFVCTTDRVVRLLGLRRQIGATRLFFKLAPHVMHYALILILAGYLSSYLFAQVLETHTLVPGGSVTLPGTGCRIAFTGFDPVYYAGERLPAFQNRILQPRARLTVSGEGEPVERILSLNRPVWIHGYGVFLMDFAPHTRSGGMERQPRIDVSIRKDAGVPLYLAGIVLFTFGLGIYLMDWLFLRKKPSAGQSIAVPGHDDELREKTMLKAIDWKKMAPVMVPVVLLCTACTNAGDKQRQSFIQIGEFAVNRISHERTEVRDGAGRTLVLVPRGVDAPKDVNPHRLVRTPVERVVAYGFFDVATLRALGVLETALVGVTHPAEDWYIPEVRQGIASGKIAYLGDSSSIDFERLKQQQPELVLTWDPAIIPMLDTLGIPCAITSTPTAMCLNARMRFVQFLAPFFGKEKEADAFFERVKTALMDIRARTAGAGPMPKVMWGDIYEKRVLVEPGNAWVGELIGLAKSDYLFDDVFGTSCIEIAVERFLYSGEEADILFTYRTKKTGATSKAALARMNPLLASIRPLKHGKVYAPLPHYVQSGDRLDEILTEIAAILHPECYPGYQYRYFEELPDLDPAPAGGAS